MSARKKSMQVKHKIVLSDDLSTGVLELKLTNGEFVVALFNNICETHATPIGSDTDMQSYCVSTVLAHYNWAYRGGRIVAVGKNTILDSLFAILGKAYFASEWNDETTTRSNKVDETDYRKAAYVHRSAIITDEQKAQLVISRSKQRIAPVLTDEQRAKGLAGLALYNKLNSTLIRHSYATKHSRMRYRNQKETVDLKVETQVGEASIVVNKFVVAHIPKRMIYRANGLYVRRDAFGSIGDTVDREREEMHLAEYILRVVLGRNFISPYSIRLSDSLNYTIDESAGCLASSFDTRNYVTDSELGDESVFVVVKQFVKDERLNEARRKGLPKYARFAEDVDEAAASGGWIESRILLDANDAESAEYWLNVSAGYMYCTFDDEQYDYKQMSAAYFIAERHGLNAATPDSYVMDKRYSRLVDGSDLSSPQARAAKMRRIQQWDEKRRGMIARKGIAFRKVYAERFVARDDGEYLDLRSSSLRIGGGELLNKDT
jgi:hypothetical protein